MSASFKQWSLGLVSVAITSAANTVVVTIFDPATFNIHEGFRKLLGLVGVTVLLHVAMYLQKSPLWTDPTNPTQAHDAPKEQ